MFSLVSNHRIIKIALFCFSCFLCFKYNYSEGTIDPNDVKSYLAEVNSAMWNIVKNYGLSNLPVPDYKLNYNVSDCYGYKLVGSLFLVEGFAFDFSKFAVDSRKTKIFLIEPNVTISGEIEIKNMQIYQDYRFEFNDSIIEEVKYSDKANGSVITEPDIFTFSFKIDKVYPSEKIYAIVNSLSDIKPALKFNPKNGLSQRLRKMYIKQSGKQIRFVFDDLRKEWKPLFDNFLKEAVKQVEFPDLNF